MFKSKRIGGGLRWLATVFAFAGLSSSALQAAAVVGQWSQNAPTTNWATSANFSSFYTAAFVTGGNTINPAGTTGEVTLSNLSHFSHFVLNTSNSAAAAAAVAAPNFADLGAWVNGGGIAILFLNGTNDAASNALGTSILRSIGSSITAPGGTLGTGGYATVGSLTGSDAAVSGLTGRSLTMISPNVVAGGSLLAVNGIPNPASNLGAALRVENIGLGRVYVFGEHFENRFYINQGGNANLQLFLNLLGQGGVQNPITPPLLPGPNIPGSDSPEPATLLLTGVALASIAWWRHKR